MNKYTVEIYQRITVEVYAKSEDEAEDMAVEIATEDGNIGIDAEICEIETTLSTDSG